MLLKFIGRHGHEFIFLPTIALLTSDAHTPGTKRSRVYLATERDALVKHQNQGKKGSLAS